MDTQVRTSFIPKKAIVAAPAQRRGGGAGIVFFVALLIFLASIALAGGAFAYDQYLAKSIESKSDQLARARAAFEPATIQDLLRLEDRLRYSKQILDGHVAPSAIFGLLSQHTLSTVSFSSFEYSNTPDGENLLRLVGTTNTYSDVALQSDEIGKARALKDAIFSGFALEDSGRVSFEVSAVVDPGFLSYRSIIAGGLSPADIEPAGTPPATTTPAGASPLP
jgi:hypothetical protein